MCCYHSPLPLPFLNTLSSNTPTLLLGTRFSHVKRSTLLNIWSPLQLCRQIRARGYYAKGMCTINKSRTGHCSLLAQPHSQSNNAAIFGGLPVVEHAINMAAKVKESDLIFMGTGTSEGIPRVSCLTSPVKKCLVCQEAVQPGNRNRRLNTSILIRYATPAGRTNILIDAGKFFYHSALRWFPHFGLRYLDALLITHSHADAIGGLDDVRDWTNNVQEFVPIYVTKRDLEMFVTQPWGGSTYSKKVDGEKIVQIIFDGQFATRALEIVKVTEPLVRVLRLVDGKENVMGYMYEAMDRAKEAIQHYYVGNANRFAPIWEIIDRRWNNQLH